MTECPVFSELAENVISTYHTAGNPSFASDVLAAVSALGTNIMLDLIRIHCPGTTITPSEPFITASVGELFDRHLDGLADDCPWDICFRLPGGMVHAIAVSGCEDRWYHGASIGESTKRVLVMDRDWCLAEILVYRCQSELSDRIVNDGTRWGVEARGFLRSMSGMPSHPHLSTVVSDSGLRKNRMSNVILILRSILATRGMYNDVPWSCKINLDIRNKGRRIRTMESDNPFLKAFAKTEFGNSISDELFDTLCRGFSMMISEGLTPTVPGDNLAVRFRTIDKKRKYNAAYIPIFRDVLVPISRPVLFVHEYGHAIDAVLGQISARNEFVDIVKMYGAYIENTPLPGIYSLDYLMKPSEIFARCYELYVSMRLDECPLVRDRSESFPGDVPEALEKSVKRYFDEVMMRLPWTFHRPYYAPCHQLGPRDWNHQSFRFPCPFHEHRTHLCQILQIRNHN